jgi:hypothetical protein
MGLIAPAARIFPTATDGQTISLKDYVRKSAYKLQFKRRKAIFTD